MSCCWSIFIYKRDGQWQVEILDVNTGHWLDPAEDT